MLNHRDITLIRQLTDRNVVIQDGATGIIKVKPTIPIPCMFGDTCAVMLKATFSNKVMHGGCSDLALESRQCGVSLYSERPLDTVYEINVTPIENGQYQTVDGDYEVFLETHTTLDYGLWKYYSLPSIQVS